jgi:XTP/dITP diphosphohydrolase
VIRLKPGDRLVVASHNPGKVKEIRALIAPFGITTLGAAELSLAEPEETGTSFAENAALKAEAAMRASGLPALSDDSGLCVAALEGAPGIHSARWAGPAKDFRVAMRRVEEELKKKGTPDARAFFVCALALAAPGAETEIFEGRVFGALSFPPRGDKGFGYDPIFVPEGSRLTFGEMDPKAKHAISHRARAFAKFVAGAIAQGTEQ